MSTPEIELQRPYQQPIQRRERKKYGNMIVFFESPFLFTLGPDCIILHLF